MRLGNLGFGLWLGLRRGCLSAAAWLLFGPPALAAEQGRTAGGKDWGFAYMLTLLCVVLGMLAVCRPGRRRERDRPEQ